MNKKQNLLAIALSASFVLGGASVAEANESQTAALVEEELLENKSNYELEKEKQEETQNPSEEISEEEISAESHKNTAEEDNASQAVTYSANITNDAEAHDDELSALEVSEQTSAPAQTSADGDDPAKDEKEIKDYSGSERYRETDLQPGDTNQSFYNTDEKVEKDGFKFELKNPSETSPSKTEYGYQITIDKKTGQRTYTKIYVTDSGLVLVDQGSKPMMGEGDKLTSESPGVTYKPGEDTSITASRRQRNLNYEASKETLKHINNKDNSSTSFGMKDDYAQENPGVKFFWW